MEDFILDESKIQPCPEKCRFNWVQFHKDLDMALAHMIEEFDGFYPSKAKLWDLVRYSHKKSQMSGPAKHTQILDQTKEFNQAMDSNKLDAKPTMAEVPVSKEWGERIKTTHRIGEHEPKDGELLNTEKCSNPNCLICYGPKI